MSPRQPGEPEFRQWLRGHTDLSPRVVNDTVSRLNRVRGMVDLDAISTEKDLVIRLLESAEFEKCNGQVKSQLKRAARYYMQYVEAEGLMVR